MIEPSFVHMLSSGAERSDDETSPHPLEIEDVDRQMREMQLVRDKAAVSARDYLIT